MHVMEKYALRLSLYVQHLRIFCSILRFVVHSLDMTTPNIIYNPCLLFSALVYSAPMAIVC